MDITLDWKGRMKFDAVGKAGFVEHMDSLKSVGGDEEASRPMDFIGMGLAGCTAMDVISVLRKKRKLIKEFQVKFHGNRSHGHPTVFTDAIIEYIFTSNDLDEDSVVRSIELSVDKYCPAVAMLRQAFPMRFMYKIFSEGEESPRIEGEYIQKLEKAI